MNAFKPESLVETMLAQFNSEQAKQTLALMNTTMSHFAGLFNVNASDKNPQAFGVMPTNFCAIPPQLSSLLNDLGGTIDPLVMQQLQQEYAEKSAALWQDMLQSKAPKLDDRRFSAPEWGASLLSSYTAAAYLLNAEYMTKLAEAVQAPKQAKQKILFSVGQMIDAMSPANFLATNPQAQKKIIDSKGESLTKGMMNMLTDMQKGHISITDESAFEVGRNVATTQGQVIFENHLFQLIQYKPLQSNVFEVPLLIVPPCINKFYILDLQPDNSLVRFALEQGHSVFLVSWVNPDASLGHVTWDDYVESGVIEAIHVVQGVANKEKINVFGFCVGGTLASSALAVLAERGEQVAASLTLLTTLLDFKDAGMLEVFIDEMQIELRENTIGQGGLMSGRDLANVFSSLRPTDLVWNYVQTNYLKGEEPPAFDLLFWNGDSTNLPGPMLCWYLRNMYLENKLKQPRKLTISGAKVDLGKIDAPLFIYGSKDDHIVPWSSAYASMSLLNPKNASKNRFILGASGHIAGVINPPAKMKRNYWSNDQAKKTLIKSPQEWFDGAQSHSGSWWPVWTAFLAEHAGKKIKAKARLGNARYKSIEAAPGRYVKGTC